MSSSRNEKIYRLRFHKNKSLAYIGGLFGISHERVRQICNEMKTAEDEYAEACDEVYTYQRKPDKLPLETFIKFYRLSTRARWGIRNYGWLHTVGELRDMPVEDMLKIPNLGKKTVAEIQGAITQYYYLMETRNHEIRKLH